MKHKMGFTLIELTGVIVVIALLLLFTLPRVVQNLDNIHQKEYERMVEDLRIATETYIETNSDDFPELDTVGGTAFISIEDLIEADLVRKDVINPLTNSTIDPNYTMSITKNSDGTLEYEYNEGNGSLEGYVSDSLKLMYDGVTAPVGTTWTDVSPNSFDGTMTGFDNTATSGWQGKYLAFDGLNDKVTSTTSISGDFTVEMSYRKDATVVTPGTSAGIFSCNTWSSTAPDPAMALDLMVLANGTRNLYMRFSVPPVGATPYSTSNIYINEANYPTTNLTITFVKTATAISVYANSSLVFSYTTTSFIDRFTLANMNLNIGNWQTIYYAILKANNFRVYDKALTVQEIANNYQIDKTRYGE